ncbi:MAG TPA: hypothetical protein VJ483_08990 [Holophagaceae bacterium]|nr:hypothetical protein [Holophagaceae bacterium]
MLKPALPDDLIRRLRKAKPRRRSPRPARPEPAPLPQVEAKALEHRAGFTHTRCSNRGK